MSKIEKVRVVVLSETGAKGCNLIDQRICQAFRWQAYDKRYLNRLNGIVILDVWKCSQSKWFFAQIAVAKTKDTKRQPSRYWKPK